MFTEPSPPNEDWVGGRFSAWSAVGVLALSLQYGFDHIMKFHQGGRDMDQHFLTAPAKEPRRSGDAGDGDVPVATVTSTTAKTMATTPTRWRGRPTNTTTTTTTTTMTTTDDGRR